MASEKEIISVGGEGEEKVPEVKVDNNGTVDNKVKDGTIDNKVANGMTNESMSKSP